MILHLFTHDKFTYDYICFINKHFSADTHLFLVFGESDSSYKIPEFNNVKIINISSKSVFKRRFLRIKNALLLRRSAQKAEKLILHGLFIKKIIIFLAKKPHLLPKTYWVVWGGDLYVHQECAPHDPLECVRKEIIPKMAGFITYIKGDFDLIQKWYGASGQWLECLCYPSNIIQVPKKISKPNTLRQRILIGNSADPTNNHINIFNALKDLDLRDVEVIVPLSYGDDKYAEAIIKEGQKRFEYFIPVRSFMPKQDYLNLLDSVSVAFFAHDRQQGMGNTIYLLSKGKKVYLRNGTTSWCYFKSIGVVCFDYNQGVSLDIPHEHILKNNADLICQHHSHDVLLNQWKGIFKF